MLPASRALVKVAPAVARSARPAAVAVRAMSTAQGNTDFLALGEGVKSRKLFHYSTYALGALVPAGVVLGGPIATGADWLLAVAIPLHMHLGLRSVCMDYVKPDSLQRVSLVAVAAFSALTFVGLAKLNATDVGLIESTKLLFRAPKKEAAAAAEEA